MGLCKCPNKKVTNLFCFEHRVNVCEQCLVESHPSCVVQSYLQWLTDSDYESTCGLCHHPLNESETIRLQCLHLLHWNCLNEWASNHPANTAPAGYRCPCCREKIFPASNQTSPLIEQLRAKLSQANWSRVAFGLPSLPEFEVKRSPATNHVTFKPQAAFSNGNIPSPPQTALDMDHPAANVSSHFDDTRFTSRKKGPGMQEDQRPLLGNGNRDVDSEENKYKRRPVGEWVSGLVKAKYGNESTRQISVFKKIFLGFCILAAIFILLTILLKSGYGSSERDQIFDPMANPNIRIAADEPVNVV
ncbi:hypothetical protein WR25_05791 [Diploscapter pachys]|uniref:Zinc finger protein-like 1 homolog n=1 Tax=Diploscapter pachys TaxID=2018661 RepID=A0A2A2K5F3_9BILA|nr:hypothetical protein WR25_05791 [Diploscapter pachys]